MADRIRVLVIEDDSDDFALTRDLLVAANGIQFVVDRTETYEAALEAMVRNEHDAYLLDYRLRGLSGVELLRAATARGCTGPAIMLTGHGDPEVDREAMRAGAVDYLAKGRVDSDLLARSIRYAVQRRRNEEELRRAREELEQRVAERTSELSEVNAKLVAEIAERRRAEQRLATQYAVARALTESATLADAAPRIIRGVCECLGWVAGAIWTVDQSANALHCVEFWHAPTVQLSEFETITRGRTFARGVGLPGRVWASGEPAWIPDVTKDSNFPRAPIAAREGLHAGFAFQIRPAGELLGVIEFFNREIRQPDEQLLQMMATLGSQIGQFIERKLTEQAIRESNRHKDEFLAMLAHELRNPLAPIRTGLDVLRIRGDRDDVTKQTREMMARQVDQLVRLVDDLLDVSRIMRGRIELRKEPVELASVIARAIETVRPLIDAQSQRLIVTTPADPVWLDADALRLAQVVANLLNNAAKYTEKAGQISLSAERLENEVVLQVRDTGVGIAPEMLPRVFDMFVQADSSVERSHGGLGIGLTLARRLVEMHGGTIEARSGGLGTGSEFIVRVPAFNEASNTGVGSDAVNPEPDARPTRCLILVVDDNADVAESIAMVLRLDGHEVLVAHDGPSALKIAAARPPVIAFMDIGMPVMDGCELARRFRREPALKETVLVALTGWGQEDDVRRTQQAGFQHHLVKPVSLATLERVLATALLAPSP
jgi:signal transduction histidine kinase/DNA-binding response OmpR family regulator